MRKAADDQLSEQEAAKRRDEALRRAFGMKPVAHTDTKRGRPVKGGPKLGSKKG
jgi:hypothetical protein